MPYHEDVFKWVIRYAIEHGKLTYKAEVIGGPDEHFVKPLDVNDSGEYESYEWAREGVIVQLPPVTQETSYVYGRQGDIIATPVVSTPPEGSRVQICTPDIVHAILLDSGLFLPEDIPLWTKTIETPCAVNGYRWVVNTVREQGDIAYRVRYYEERDWIYFLHEHDTPSFGNRWFRRGELLPAPDNVEEPTCPN